MNYPYDSILINHRTVSIEDICRAQAKAETEFESATFKFISAWFSGTDAFTTQTSGSTGTPKNLTFTKSQLIASASRTLKALNLTESTTALVCLNTNFIAGKMMLVRALLGNMKIIAKEPIADPFHDLLEQIDFVAVVPLQLQSILKNPKNASHLKKLQTLIIGGAPLPSTLYYSIQSLPCSVYATYGMTETISHIALQRLNGPRPDQYFTTLSGIAIKQDHRDCLIIESPELPEPVVTNDIVELISDHTFYIVGRWDSIINSGGIKISPEKVELAVASVFHEFGIDAEFCVIGMPDETFGERLILLMEGAPVSDLLSADILYRLSGKLSKYEVPKAIQTIRNFPRTPTGKIDRLRTKRQIL
jgi:o-succinylbenzoate---CoA ligase